MNISVKCEPDFRSPFSAKLSNVLVVVVPTAIIRFQILILDLLETGKINLNDKKQEQSETKTQNTRKKEKKL